MIKADNNENTLDSNLGKKMDDIASQLGIEPVEEPVVQPKPKAKKKTTPKKPKTPASHIPTLSEFTSKAKFEASDEYKEALEEEENLKKDLEDPSVLSDLLQQASSSSLESIVILDDDDDEFSDLDAESLNYVINTKPTYEVVLNQSAYIAHLEGLRYSDILSVNHTTSSAYEEALRKYQVYYSKINRNSIGLKTFAEFIHNTSLFDADTLAFGIFNQTFPGETEFNITCRHCQKQLKDVKISNDQLISARNDDSFKQLDRVINSISDVKGARKYSVTNKTERIKLPATSIVVDVKQPTIEDHLSLLKEINENRAAEIESFELYLLYIKQLLVPNLAKLKKTNQLTYRPITKKNEILKFLKSMNIEDTKALNATLDGKSDQYLIEYKIKSFPCAHCGEDLGDIAIDPEALLFQQALLRLQLN